MIRERVQYFENVIRNTSMDRRNSRKSAHGKGTNNSSTLNEHQQDKVKQFVLNLTEIKRPQSKMKASCEEAYEGSNTLPKTKSRRQRENGGKSSTFSKRSSNAQRDKRSLDKQLSNPSTSSELNENRIFQNQVKRHSYNSSFQNDTIEKKPSIKHIDGTTTISNDSMVEANEDIEEQVLAFGEKLRLKRLTSSFCSSDHDDNFEAPSLSKEEPEEEGEENVKDEEILPSNIEDISVAGNSLDNSDEITFSETQDEDQNYLVQSFNPLLVDPDADIFGLNDFNDNDDDNYITEAFNDEGRELILTFFEINRHVVHNENNVELEDLKNESDIVVYENDNCDNEAATLANIDFQDDYTNANLSDEEDPIYVEVVDDNSGEIPNRSSMKLVQPLNEPNEYEEIKHDNYYPNLWEIDHNNVRNFKGNLHDDNGNLRIQTVAINGTETLTEGPTANETSTSVTKKEKISYIIDELINTEEIYLAGLKKIVEHYIPFVEMNAPDNLIGKYTYLFGNITDIYEGSKKFLNVLKNDTSSVEKVAEAFLNSEELFNLYPLYSKNKPTADIYLKEFDHIVKVCQQMLGDKLDLSSYLLTPIQRLGKYILMLENIQKELKKQQQFSHTVDKAVHRIKYIMRRGNDSIAIDSIKNCPINLLLQGSFIMREKFNILKPKKMESMVFLFEKIVVFTVNTSKGGEEFTYYDSIQMTDLSIALLEDKALVFHLTDYPKNKKSNSEAHTYVLEAKTAKIKNTWTVAIGNSLWHQLEKAKEHVKKLHDDQGKRMSQRPLPKREGSKNSSRSRTTWYNKSQN